MSIATVITLGYGSFGSPSDVITLGYLSAAAPQPTTDTHDGHYEDYDFDILRKKEKEQAAARERLRNQIRNALEGNRQEVIEAIAPYAEPNVPIESVSLDWDAFLADVKAIEAVRELLRQQDRARRLAADDEDLMMLVL